MYQLGIRGINKIKSINQSINTRLYKWDLIYHQPPLPPIASNLNCKTKTKLRALNGQRNENRSLVMNVNKHEE